MAKQFGSYIASVLGERVRSPVGEFGSPGSYSMMGRMHFDPGVRTVVDDVWRYENDHWIIRQDALTALWNHVAWGYLGRVHYAWGQIGLGRSEVLDHYRYDGDTDTHVAQVEGVLPIRVEAVSFTIGSRTHVATGRDPDNIENDQRGRLRRHDSWDETNESWVNLQDVTDPLYRTNAVAFVLANRRGYVVGGEISDLGAQRHGHTDSNRTGQNYEYDPMTDSWAERTWFPNLHHEDQADYAMDQAAAAVYAETRGFCWNGTAAFAFQANWAYHYEAGTDAWVRHENVPEAAFGAPPKSVMPRFMAAVRIAGEAHLIGGALERLDLPPEEPNERLNFRFDHRGEAWWQMAEPPLAKDANWQVTP